MQPLTPHTKKLIGAIVMLIWLPVYALAAAAVAVHVLPGANWLVELLYYVVAGTLWIVPIGLMLPWMHREPRA
jgi:membrane protein implicated in regulation of membrane protease activity